MHRVADCIIRRVIPEPTEWQRVRNQINTAFVFARTDFVSVHAFHAAPPSYAGLLPDGNYMMLFICHASEDRDDFVRPLAEELSKEYEKIWYCE